MSILEEKLRDILRLPPRKIWVLGIGGLILILVVFVFAQKTQSPSENQGNESSSVTTVPNQKILGQTLTKGLSELDSDKDGLRDWEEPLWNSDPNNPDTDGDGTLDGDEVDQGRNPIVAGPNDKLSQNLDQASGGKNAKPLSATDVLARKFFTDYITLRKSGGIGGQAGRDFLARRAESQVPVIKGKQYKEKDLRVVPNSVENARAYGNTLATILITTKSSGDKNELQILEDALVLGKKEELAKLEDIRLAFGTVISSMLGTPVPKDAVAEQLTLLNGLSGVKTALLGLQNIYKDPLSGLASLELYRASAPQVAQALRGINTYLRNKGVEFSDGEAGAFFYTITP